LPCVFRWTFVITLALLRSYRYAVTRGGETGLSRYSAGPGYTCPLVEIPEASLASHERATVMRELCDHGLTVLIERAGDA